MRVRQLRIPLAAGCLVVSAGVSQAVIVHPGETFTVPALESVVGRWGGNASAVAIGPNHILTTRHQGGGIGTSVVFGGNTYFVDQVTLVGSADLRIARIETIGGADANLAAYTPIYDGVDIGASVTIGGFGKGPGTTLTTTGGTYGYQWLAESNTTLRFGNNTVDSAETGAADLIPGGISVTNDLLVADFDGPSLLSPGEGMITEFDSGGGWFVNNGGVWQVAALSRAIGHVGPNADDPSTPAEDPQPLDRALFASFQNANVPAPDYLDGVRLASYREFINGQVPEPGTMALLALAGAGLVVRRRRR